MSFRIRELNLNDKQQLISFGDKFIGENYLDVEAVFNNSSYNNKMFSKLATDTNGNIIGIRLTYPPGPWQNTELFSKCHPEQWKVHPDKVAYFKSLFIDSNYQGQGIGPKLSNLSIAELIENGTKAIVTHCWKESPNNSSQKYLIKMGFETVTEVPNFWKDVDYLCNGCQQKPCICTAYEMIYYL